MTADPKDELIRKLIAAIEHARNVLLEEPVEVVLSQEGLAQVLTYLESIGVLEAGGAKQPNLLDIRFSLDAKQHEPFRLVIKNAAS